MIYYKSIPVVLQSNKFPNPGRGLDYSGQKMLPEIGDYFFNALLVWVAATRARGTRKGMGRLVAREEQHPATLQTFYARIIKERVIAFRRLSPRSQRSIRDGRSEEYVACRGLVRLRVTDAQRFAESVLVPDEVIERRGSR